MSRARSVPYKKEVRLLLNEVGDEDSKKKFREVASMTEIGKMIFEDGKAEGKTEGKAEGKAEVLIKLLLKKFKFVPKEYMDKIKTLPEAIVENIATDIFDIDKVDELERYFTKK